MKKLLLCSLMLCLMTTFGQKKKNGTVYIKHPAIDVINEMYAAVNQNNLEKLGELFADDFKGVNGDNINKDAEPVTKEEFINKIKSLSETITNDELFLKAWHNYILTQEKFYLP